MTTVTDIEDFQNLIDDPNFPKSLLTGKDAIARLQDEFINRPAQFTQTVMAAMYQQRVSKWETPEGQALLKKLNLSKADVMRWS